MLANAAMDRAWRRLLEAGSLRHEVCCQGQIMASTSMGTCNKDIRVLAGRGKTRVEGMVFLDYHNRAQLE